METENLQQEYDEHQCWGMLASVDLYDCNPRHISDPKKIEQFIIELCDQIKMVRHGNAMIERFAEGELEGYSALQFIETSSITMHFDEQKNRAFVDIFSCKYFDIKTAEEFCQKFLEAGSAKTFHHLRY